MDLLIADSSVNLAGADTPPVSGTPQYATDGNPSIAVQATVWPAYWLNGLMLELMAILTAGSVTPDRTVFTQLRDALRAMFNVTYSSGVFRFPGGIIIMIANYTINVSGGVGSAQVNYPATFPTAVIGVIGGPYASINTSKATAAAQNNSNAHCQLYVSDDTTGGTASGWVLAIGL